MEVRNIEDLRPNPENDRILTEKGKALLLYEMSLGDHSAFLITPEGMIVDGNNRWNLRYEANWNDTQVQCRILSWEQDQGKAANGEKSWYALIDGAIVKDNEVIPHFYIDPEALIKAYSFSRNSEAAYDDPDAIANKFHKWQLDPDKTQVHFFPPDSLTETLKKMAKAEKKKSYQLIIMCNDESDMDSKYSQLTSIGITPKRKI